MEYRLRHQARWRQWLSGPFIWGMAIPLIFLHICLEVYQQVCFRLYAVERLSWRTFIRFDRGRLPYLSGLEKLFCNYCAYANGLLRYATAIAARTEKYWCGIRHQPQSGFAEPEHHRDFVAFGDRAEWERRYGKKEEKSM